MIWRNSIFGTRSGSRLQAPPSLLILALLAVVSTLTLSCKKECVDLCEDYRMVKEEGSCSCVCDEAYTPFQINGYTYCFEESEEWDYYILKNVNPESWLIEEDVPMQKIPDLLIIKIPKDLASEESYYIFEDSDPVPYRLLIDYYHGQSGARGPWPLEIRRFENFTSPVIVLEGPGQRLHWPEIRHLRDHFFHDRTTGASLGIIDFNETLEKMGFNVLVYKHFEHSLDAFYNLSLGDIFDFPFHPGEGGFEPYDPEYYHYQFSRLNFDE